MIRPLRRRHFRVLLVMGVVLVLLWFASLAARQPVEDYLGQISSADRSVAPETADP